MSAADRLKSLKRIASVQGEMVKLAQWRLADAQRRCRELSEDRDRLASFLGGDDPLNAGLAKAVARTSRTIDRRLADAQRASVAQEERLRTARRGEKTVGSMVEAAASAAQRAEEAKTLEGVLDAFLAAAASKR